MVIAIDGPAASGKGTLARRLATHLGIPHLDTGLLYRAVAAAMMDRDLPLADAGRAGAVARALQADWLDGERLRGEAVGEAASIVSAHAQVRDALLDFQRRFAAQPGGAVLDGRDIGTVVCPDAEVKLFVTASADERARRRRDELAALGKLVTTDAVREDIHRRDRRDEDRAAAPLRQSDGAHRLDTTGLDADAAFARALDIIEAARAR